MQLQASLHHLHHLSHGSWWATYINNKGSIKLSLSGGVWVEALAGAQWLWQNASEIQITFHNTLSVLVFHCICSTVMANQRPCYYPK